VTTAEGPIVRFPIAKAFAGLFRIFFVNVPEQRADWWAGWWDSDKDPDLLGFHVSDHLFDEHQRNQQHQHHRVN
jgi:hypothetical protein